MRFRIQCLITANSSTEKIKITIKLNKMQETFQIGRPLSQSLVVARRDRVLDLPDELDPHLRHIVPCSDGIENQGASSQWLPFRLSWANQAPTSK